MTRFVKIDGKLINIDMICAVTDRHVRVVDDRFKDNFMTYYKTEVEGINVFLGNALEDSCIPLKNETVDSFLEKVNVVLK